MQSFSTGCNLEKLQSNPSQSKIKGNKWHFAYRRKHLILFQLRLWQAVIRVMYHRFHSVWKIDCHVPFYSRTQGNIVSGTPYSLTRLLSLPLDPSKAAHAIKINADEWRWWCCGARKKGQWAKPRDNEMSLSRFILINALGHTQCKTIIPRVQ